MKKYQFFTDRERSFLSSQLVTEDLNWDNLLRHSILKKLNGLIEDMEILSEVRPGVLKLDYAMPNRLSFPQIMEKCFLLIKQWVIAHQDLKRELQEKILEIDAQKKTLSEAEYIRKMAICFKELDNTI